MSVEEPEPGAELGFTSVVSTSVHPSPLKPHWPGWRSRGWKLENKSDRGDLSLILTGTYPSADSYNTVVRDMRQNTEKVESGRTRWQR